MGAYADPTANKLMAQVDREPDHGGDPERGQVLRQEKPVLYMPVQDWIMAVSNKVGGTTDGFMQMTQQQLIASLLWVNK